MQARVPEMGIKMEADPTGALVFWVDGSWEGVAVFSACGHVCLGQLGRCQRCMVGDADCAVCKLREEEAA